MMRLFFSGLFLIILISCQGFNNQKACNEFIDGFNSLSCVSTKANLQLSKTTHCPATLNDNNCDMTEYYSCLLSQYSCDQTLLRTTGKDCKDKITCGVTSNDVDGLISALDEASTPIPVALTISSEKVTFDHKVGTTSCPQEFGKFTVTNTGSEVATMTITLSTIALSVSESTFELKPGESKEIVLNFTCSQSTSFDGKLTVEAKGKTSGQTATAEMIVTGSVK